MLLILGTFRIDPDRLDMARSVMAAMIVASRAEDGCIDYVYAEDVLDRGLIHVKELWADEAAFARHVAAPHLSAWRATWPDLGIRDRNLRRYVVGASEPA
jgi:quinol monooxygenase YgiN